MSGKGYGNLISLPFQGAAAKNACTIFMDPASQFKEPYKKADQFRILCAVEGYEESYLDSIIKNFNLKIVAPSPIKNVNHLGNNKNSFIKPSFEKIIKKCPFLDHCRKDSYTLSYDEWWILGTIAVRCVDGEKLFHRLSVNYPTYSQKETNNLIKSIKNFVGGPHTCRYIEEKTNDTFCSDCRHRGKIKSPIVLGIVNLEKYIESEIKYYREYSQTMLEEMLLDVFENDQNSGDEISHDGVYLFETDIDYDLLEDWSDSYDDKEPDDHF